MKLLRRNTKAADPAGAEPLADDGSAAGVSEAEKARRAAYTPGKGKATPKRRDVEPRRPRVAEPPPTTRREAYKRMRQRSSTRRAAGRTAAGRGAGAGGRPGERPLPARDQGPEKAFVRNVVDSRRNIGSIFLFVALAVFIAYVSQSAAIRAWAISAWLAIFLLIIVDSFLLVGRIRKGVTARFPEASTRGLGWYGVQRSTMIRRWRLPKPLVKPGDTI